jgi:hypothetical protein
MYINIGASSDSEKYEQIKTGTSGKPIKAVNVSNVYVYIFCTS